MNYTGVVSLAEIVAGKVLVAALTDGAKIPSDSTIANVSNGIGYQANLTADKGIAVAADAAMTTGTSITVSIDYLIT